MNEATRRELVDSAADRALAHPADVERPVAEGAAHYRSRLVRVYAAWIAGMVVVAAGLLLAHPATGILTSTTVESVSVEPVEATLFVDESVGLVADVRLSDGTRDDAAAVEWRTSDAAVATVEGGMVTAISVGAATITAEVDGVSGTAAITVVEEPEAELTAITLNPDSVELERGDETGFTATGAYDDDTTVDLTATVTWESSDQDVATVDANGRVRAIAEGTTQITATEGDIAGQATVTVGSARLTGIRIQPDEIQLRVRDTQQLEAIGEYSDDTTSVLDDVTWRSSDLKSVQVTTDGVVTGIGWDTTATITAEAGGFTATATAVVLPAELVSITVTPEAPTISQDGEVQLTAKGRYGDGSTRDLEGVEWTTPKPQIASVDPTGLVTAVKVGTVMIRASFEGKFDTAFVTVEFAEP